MLERMGAYSTVVTRAVTRLNLNWPQEQEAPRPSRPWMTGFCQVAWQRGLSDGFSPFLAISMTISMVSCQDFRPPNPRSGPVYLSERFRGRAGRIVPSLVETGVAHRAFQATLECEKGWRAASDFRSSQVEALLKNIQVQNVDNQDDLNVSQIQSVNWFVLIDLKDAYFHIEFLPHTGGS